MKKHKNFSNLVDSLDVLEMMEVKGGTGEDVVIKCSEQAIVCSAPGTGVIVQPDPPQKPPLDPAEPHYPADPKDPADPKG